MRFAALPFLCIVVIVIGLPAAGAETRVIAPPGPKPIGPYSPGILAGDFLYVSGQTNGSSAFSGVTATIKINGVTYKSVTSTGPFVIATASGSCC